MLCVLVVDDEEWIRLGIVSKLKKSHLNFQKILQSPNAEQALELASKEHPDIILCDIRMDGMNGLVFIHKLMELLPDTKIVIISGYNDFSYAKEAIQLGVVDYLLKPIDTPSLNQALEKCVRQIEQTRQHRNALETIKKAQLRKTLRSAASNLLSQDTPDYTQLFSAYCSNGMFQAYYLYLDISCSLSADTLDEHLSRLFHQFILGVNLVYYENQCNEFLIALYLSSDEKDFKPEEFADKLENSLCSEIQYITPHQYTFGISMVNPNLCQAIHEAIFCMKHRVLCANKNRIHPGDIAAFASAKTDFSFLSDFKESLIRKDQNRLEATLKFMYHSIEESSICYEGLQNIYLRILVLLGEYCSPTVTQALQMPTEIYHFSSVWDWIDFLKELLTRFFETEKPLSVEGDSRLELVGQVQAFIQENFSKKFSLSDIAQQQHINYCYLSLLFKEVSKVTFQDYLMEIRLNHARQLLQIGTYKIKDVAEQSGFSDQHYFSKTFKKATGYSPKEYQMTCQDGNCL